MIIEHRTRDKHQNADRLSKKTEFYDRQEQREADRPEIKDGFSFMDKETYDSLRLTRWLDKSGKPIESKIVGETLKAKGYDLDEVKTVKATIGHDLMRLLEKLADEKPVVSTRRNDEPEFSIMRSNEVSRDENSLKAGEPENKEVVRTLVDKIPDDILRQTTPRRKKVSFK